MIDNWSIDCLFMKLFDIEQLITCFTKKTEVEVCVYIKWCHVEYINYFLVDNIKVIQINN
jgi:hypothetical protein